MLVVAFGGEPITSASACGDADGMFKAYNTTVPLLLSITNCVIAPQLAGKVICCSEVVRL